MLIFGSFYSSKNPEKKCSQLFNIDNKDSQKSFLSSKSELFLKDHLTLKTGVMMLNYILKCFQIESSFF